MPNIRLNKMVKFAMVLLVVTSFAIAQGPRNGTVAGSHLLVPQGARYLSGGGATANGIGAEAIYWNPAGLARAESNVDVVMARRSFIADINISYIAAALKLGSFGSLGLSARTFNIGEIERTTVFAPDGTGEKFTPTVFVLGTTFSRLMSDRTSVGVNLNFINEGFAGVGASGVALDAGVQYSSFLDIPGLNIGVALRNFGPPMRYDGSALWIDAPVDGSNRQSDWYKVVAAPFDMPFNMDIAASYNMDLGTGSLDLGFTFENNNAAQDEYRMLARYNFGTLANVRLGYLMSAEVTDDENSAIDESLLHNIFGSYSFGATLNLAQFTGVNVSLDYAYFGTWYFNDNQVFALRFGL